MTYKIVQKRDKHALYAAGFYSLERAQAWLEKYNPNMWDDKTIQAHDLEIVPERRTPPMPRKDKTT